MADRKIVTSHVCPPIPWREFDWAAWFDDTGPEGPCAYGRTEEAAISALLEDDE